METPAVPALLIGTLFVEKGLITQEQLDVALEEQRRTGNRLGEVLVDRFGVSRLDLAGALAEQWAEYERQGTPEQLESHAEARDLVAVSDEWSGGAGAAETTPKRPIGEIFVERGMISANDLSTALEEQRTSGRRLGEILVSQGNLSRLELASALADQWASFQKLRPPAAAENGAAPEVVPQPVLPTPEVTQQAQSEAVPAPDLTALRERLDTLGAQLGELSAATPEWRRSLDDLKASLEERFGAIEQAMVERPVADSLRGELAALVNRVDELGAALALPPRDPLAAELAERVESLADDLRGRIAAIEETAGASSEEAADHLQGLMELRSELATLDARLEALPAPSEEWKEWVDVFATRLDDLAARPNDGLEQLRGELVALEAGFAARVDALPLPTDEWRVELGQVADNLRLRFERIETDLAARAATSAVAQLDARLAALADGVPAGFREAQDELRALASRVDAISAPSEEWRAVVEQLSSRIDAIPSSNEEWRDGLADLAARIDALPVPSDEWRIELGLVAENLRVRFERVENDLAGRGDDGALAALEQLVRELSSRLDATPAPNDEWREGIRGLTERLDALPVPNVDWRDGLDALAARIDAIPENLRVRLDRIDGNVATRAADAGLTELSNRLDEIAALVPDRVGELQRPGLELLAGLRDELQELSGRTDARLRDHDGRSADHIAQLERLAERAEASEGIEQRLLDELTPLIDHAVESVTGRVVQVEGRLAGEVAALAGLAPRVDEVAERLEKHDRRLEKHWRRLEELRDAGPSATEVAEALGSRLDASEAFSTDALAGFDDRLAGLDRRLEAGLAHSGTDVDSLRRELDDARGVTAAAAASATVHAEHLAEALRAELAARIADIDQPGQIEHLEGLVARQSVELEALHAAIREREQLLDARLAELETVSGRLEQVESTVAGADSGLQVAVAETHARIAGLEGVDVDLRDKLAVLEKAQAKRSDVRELRDALARVEQYIAADEAKEDARVHAVEEALRDGLAALGARLSETEGAYFRAGDALRRSIEQLGSAIRATDDQPAPAAGVAPAPLVATSFLAFAPSIDGYRLVEVESAPPTVGDLVELPGCKGSFVVARLGASPLPFDRRACVYLEQP